MGSRTLSRKVQLPASVVEAFQWHARPGAFERLNPPWRPVRVSSSSGHIRDGARVTVELPLGPIGIPWILEHRNYRENSQFSDEQISGPFRYWRHDHLFEPVTEHGSTLEDRISYKLPLATSVFGPLVERELSRLFTYRHAVTRTDLELHARWKGAPRSSILMAGSSGFIGSALRAFLSTGGHIVRRLVRGVSADSGARVWNPNKGELPQHVFDGVDAVVHLGGESIADGRWSPERKERIRRSRVDSTRLICSTVANLTRKPKVLVMASAIGVYGDTGDREVDESSPAGTGFLADVGQEWEAATRPAVEAGVRVVNVRIGIVLDPAGGALGKMLPPFNVGAGGVLGSGNQYMSWISLEDLLGVFEHVLLDDGVSGPVNAVSPNPVTNREFTSTLGAVLGRPTLVPLPRSVISTLFGEMGETVLLESTRALPTVLLRRGYTFAHPLLPQALQFGLGFGG